MGKKKQSKLSKHESDHHFAIKTLNFIALLLYLITGALERSTLSSSIDSKDSSFWGGKGRGKLRHGLILRPKPAASSNTVSEKWRQQCFNNVYKHCTRADSHHRILKKSFMYSTVFHLAFEHIANFWQQVRTACSCLHQCQLLASCYAQSDLPDAKTKPLSNIKQISNFFLGGKVTFQE